MCKFFLQIAKQIVFAFLFSLFLFSPILAKNSEFPYYFVEVYDHHNGLPTSDANDLLQTRDGQIWIASYSTLMRYDGRNFYPQHDQGISSVLSLYEDSKKRLWIGTNNDGVVLYDNNTYDFLTADKAIPSYSTRCITETSDGTILVGTVLGVYKVLPDLSIEVLTEPELTDIFVSDLVSFGDNKTVGLTKAGDVFILDGSDLITYIPYDSNNYATPLSVLVLEENGETIFYLSTNEDYILKARINPKKPNDFLIDKISTKPLYHINAMEKDSLERIWIAADSGVGFITPDGSLEVLDYIQEASFETVLEDIEGNIWLASSKEGVLKLTESQFQNVTSVLDVSVQINAVEELDGLLYLVSPKGLFIIDKNTKERVENALTKRYEGAYFRCVEKDLEGNLWFSSYTDDRLIKYNPKTEKITPISESKGLNTPRIRSTMVAADGSVWAGTGNGVYVVKDEKVVAHYGSDEGLKNIEILTITQDAKGRIFVGTDGAGVYVIEDGKIIKNISRADGLRSDIVLRTETDPINGGTWIITGNSIAFYNFDTNEIKNIENFPYNNNFDILFYGENIVILSSNGIYLTTQKDLLAGAKVLPHIYKNHLDGLSSTPVANAFPRIIDDVLYICTYQNLSSFDLYNKQNQARIIPNIDLTRIIANEKAVYPIDEKYFKLDSNANFIELDIRIPTYILQDYKIAHEIEGYDGFVQSSNYKDFLNPTYINLPGGSYILRVDLIDSRSQDIIASEKFRIVKKYTMFENPTVRLISFCVLIICLLLIIYLYFQQRVKKIKEQQKLNRSILKDVVQTLAKVIDAKDRYTNGHSTRVAHYSRIIARNMGFSPDEEEDIYCIALLHDIGKVSIPDEVLNKPGRLNEEEFKIMQSHASKGADILENIHHWPDLVLGSKYHHERYDGTGYPNRLKGEDIPLVARIICVADSFDAMYSSRVYRKKMEMSFVLEELKRNIGTQFDPKAVDVLINLITSGSLDEVLSELNPS